MSFFSKDKPIPEVDLSQPSIPGLIHLLRNKPLWPKGFTWNYQFLSTCALGLARYFWIPTPIYSELGGGNSLGMPRNAFDAIFFGLADVTRDVSHPWVGYTTQYDRVTPEKVADALEKYLQSPLDPAFDVRRYEMRSAPDRFWDFESTGGRRVIPELTWIDS